jgi:hypothetical protein
MTQAQIDEFKRRAKAAGKTDSEIDTFIRLKMNAIEAQQPQTPAPTPVEQPKKDGFLKSVAKGIASPFLKLGATADALGTSKYLGGKGTNNSVKNTPLGTVKPITTAREAAGVGLELAANAVGGGGAVGIAKGVAKGAAGQVIKSGIVQGVKAGALGGAGIGLQQDNATVGSVAKSAGVGAIGGGLVGGAVAAIPGLAIGGYKAAAGVKNFIKPEATIALTKAIKPTANNTKFIPALKAVLPDIAETAELTGSKIKNLDDLSKVVTVAKQRVWKSYQSILGPQANVEVQGNEIADSILSSVNSRFASQNPSKFQRIQEVADSYRRSFTLEELEDYLEAANNDLFSYYAKNKVGQKVAAGDPEVSHVIREAQAIRKLLYGKLNTLTGKNAAALKQKWGALTNIQNEIQRRTNVAARQNPDSLAEQLSFASGVGKVLKSAANTEFGDAISGAGQIVASRYLKNKNSTDSLIETAFSKLNKRSK